MSYLGIKLKEFSFNKKTFEDIIINLYYYYLLMI